MTDDMTLQMRVRVRHGSARLPAGAADEHADADAAGDPATSLAARGQLCRDRRRRGAVGGTFHRARQSVDPSALRELPSGRRPPAPGRAWPAAPAAGRARRGRLMASPAMRCPICHQARQFRSRPACRATRNGISRRARWRGRARRSARSAPRSRTPRAMAAGRWTISPSHRHRHSGRLGLGARVRPQAGSGHAEAGGRAGRGMGENRRGVPELDRG